MVYLCASQGIEDTAGWKYKTDEQAYFRPMGKVQDRSMMESDVFISLERI